MTVVSAKRNFYFFSKHASEQLRERTILDRSDILQLLANDLYLPVGKDKHRIHTLIFSARENTPYVIVYDERNLEIITILYVDYNNKFVISPIAIDTIRDMTLKIKKPNPAQVDMKLTNKSKKKKKKQPMVKEKASVLTHDTDWISFFHEFKAIPAAGPLNLVINYNSLDGSKEKATVMEIDSNEFNNDIPSLISTPFFKEHIEKTRLQYDIPKENIINISLEFISGNLIKIANSAPYIKLVEFNSRIKAKIEVLPTETDWIHFLHQFRAINAIGPSELIIQYRDCKNNKKTQTIMMVDLNEFDNDISKFINMESLKDKIEITRKHSKIKAEDIISIALKLSTARIIKIAVSLPHIDIIQVEGQKKAEAKAKANLNIENKVA